MKVLQIINSLHTGGAEKLLTDSVPLYQEKGIQTDVLLLSGKQTPLKEKLLEKTQGQIFLLGQGSVYSMLHIFRIMNYLKKYDLVHVHLFPALYWVALAKVLSFSKIKLVYTEHNTNNRRRSNPFLKIADKILYRQYSSIVTIADEVDTALKEHLKYQTEKFRLIQNGIDTHNFAMAQPYPKDGFFAKDSRILIQVSSFSHPKDQRTVINAMKLLPANVKLLLVGEGPLKAECEQLVNENGLESHVKFLGIRMDVARLLQTADIVILSSAYEGLSLSSLEGMACEKPFVATDAPGLRKVVGGAGLLFETGNEKELAQKIVDLLSDSNYYEKIAAQCLQRAKQFDIHKTIENYTKLYEEIIKSGQ